jgi:hypothetical protein
MVGTFSCAGAVERKCHLLKLNNQIERTGD